MNLSWLVQAKPTEKHAPEEEKGTGDDPGDDVAQQDDSKVQDQEQGEEEETGGCEDPEVPVERLADDMAADTQAENDVD